MSINPLPPLSLIALHHTKDGAFDPSETWIAACDAIDKGHDADDVAALLLTLPTEELDELREDWMSHTQSTFEDWEGRALWAADIPLCRALNRLDPTGGDWPLPYLDGGEACAVLDERDTLKAENAKLRAALSDLVFAAARHNDALNTEDQPNGPQCPTGDDYNALLDMIEDAAAVLRAGLDKALGK